MGAADGSIFARQKATVGGFEVPYLRGGLEGETEPVLYLHGMGGGGKWEAYHMAMGTVTLTYAPQLPGWQEGRPPEGITCVRDYASLMLDFLDTVGIDKATLVGHSIGGWIALYVATEHPERVSRLVLADTIGLHVPEAPTANLEAMDQESFATGVFARLGLIATAQPDGFGAEWENVRQGPEFERQWKGRAIVANLANGVYTDPELTSKIRDISADVLLIWGRLDGIVPVRQGEALRAMLPRSALRVVERAGHLPMVEKPETFHRLVRDFLVGAETELPDVAIY